MGSSESKVEEDIGSKKEEKKEEFSTKIVQIKINTFSGYWEKPYNIEETLLKISEDFKNDNDMCYIQTNYFIEWTYNNTQIEMDSKKLKTFMEENNLINNDNSPILINQQIKPIKGKENLILLNKIDIAGKPLFNPFRIILFDLKSKKLIPKEFDNEIIIKYQLDKIGIQSAYCNGENHLFISGGVDPNNQNILDTLWDIDLKNNFSIKTFKISPKKNHSMILTANKVFIVGGEDKKCMYYNLEAGYIAQIEELNKARFEPSLIQHDEFLFCFDASRKKVDDKFSFEKLNLENLDKQKWEIVYPDIQPSLGGESVFSQKFFGVVEDFRQNILFLGGIYDKNNNLLDKNMCLKYNINKNMMEKSDISFQEISFSEKTFLPFDDKNYFILPNFTKNNYKIVIYSKEKNICKIVSNKLKPEKKNANLEITAKFPSIKVSLNGINLDMPGLHKEIDLNPSKIEFKSSEEIQMNDDINNNSNNISVSFNPELNNIENENINNNNIEKDDNLIIEGNNNDEHKEENQKINNDSKEEAKDLGLVVKNDNLIESTHHEEEKNNSLIINDIDKSKNDKNDKVVEKSKMEYSKFHCSVNDPCNMKKKKNDDIIYPPKYIDPKLIKQRARNIINLNYDKIKVENY